MSSKIDLHLHTIYSDGRNTLETIVCYQQNFMLKYISITDHNTIQGNIDLWQQGRMPSQFIVGTELRLPGIPDMLLYFPQISLLKAMELEEQLKNICRLDQDITLEIAKEYIDNNALLVWKNSPYFNNQGNYWLGTLQLAQMISNKLQPSSDIITEIRNKKSNIFKNPGDIEAARELNDIASFDWINRLTSRYNGIAVLAHPYREIVRRLRGMSNLNFSIFKTELEAVIKEIANNNINTLEHITVYSRNWWEQHFDFSTIEANEIFIEQCKINNLNVTVGSDSHDINQNADIMPSIIKSDVLSTFLPDWLK